VMIASTLINGGQVPQVRLCSPIEETPQNAPIHYSNCSSPRIKLSRYRSMFGNCHCMSPLTPSFGILPLEINTRADSSTLAHDSYGSQRSKEFGETCQSSCRGEWNLSAS